MFSMLCDVIFVMRLLGNFEIDPGLGGELGPNDSKQSQSGEESEI